MAQPYVGEIRMVGFNFAPSGWAFCNGQLLPISQNAALFALIGTFYGGNGTTTFALPNLQSRVAIHQGTGNGLSTYDIGQAGGLESVALQYDQMPIHNVLLYILTLLRIQRRDLYLLRCGDLFYYRASLSSTGRCFAYAGARH